MENFEVVACPVCGKNDFDITYKAAYPSTISREDLLHMYSSSSNAPLLDQLVRCRSCAMQYVTPRVSSDIVQESYRNAKDEAHWEQSAARVASFRRNLSIVLKKLKLAPSADIRVLDIGSAGGYFLRAAKDMGLTATGVEPSVFLSEMGRKQLNVDLRTGTLEGNHFEKNSFELGSVWDVLEHVPDAGRLLDQIRPLLTEKGHLIVSYPDYDSIARKILQRKWPFFLNVHLYYFTPQTLTDLLQRHGFRVLFIKPYFLTLDMGYLLKRAAAVLPGFAPIAALCRWLRIDRLPIRYQMGQTILVAEKN
jgi:2-polyprenyl-3-methyl-5-hydroxy-6-metoxy-1,4-benzoquinol methylase